MMTQTEKDYGPIAQQVESVADIITTPAKVESAWQRWGLGPILVEHKKSLAAEPPIRPGTPDPYVPTKKK